MLLAQSPTWSENLPPQSSDFSAYMRAFRASSQCLCSPLQAAVMTGCKSVSERGQPGENLRSMRDTSFCCRSPSILKSAYVVTKPLLSPQLHFPALLLLVVHPRQAGKGELKKLAAINNTDAGPLSLSKYHLTFPCPLISACCSNSGGSRSSNAWALAWHLGSGLYQGSKTLEEGQQTRFDKRPQWNQNKLVRKQPGFLTGVLYLQEAPKFIGHQGHPESPISSTQPTFLESNELVQQRNQVS